VEFRILMTGNKGILIEQVKKYKDSVVEIRCVFPKHVQLDNRGEGVVLILSFLVVAELKINLGREIK